MTKKRTKPSGNKPQIFAEPISLIEKWFKSPSTQIGKRWEGYPSLTGWNITLLLGGGILLTYALSVGELPEFTLSDLTGTLVAICATGIFFVTVLSAYSLLAGLMARIALESTYPREAQHLVRGPFIVGVTGFTFLAWSAFVVSKLDYELAPPHQYELEIALGIALLALSIILFLDWRPASRRFCRNLLLSVFAGSIAMLIILVAAASVDPSNLIIDKPLAPKVAASSPFEWQRYVIGVLGHIYLAAICVCFVAILILSRRANASLGLKRATRLPSRNRVKRARFCQLFWTKSVITLAFVVSSLVVLLIANLISHMAEVRLRGMSLFCTGAFLIMLNWFAFYLHTWKDRMALGLLTAVILFIFLPLLNQNLTYLPKQVVSMLGLGEQHIASVALSNRQCAALAPYGVKCAADGDRAITLTNVNLLNRLGSSMVFELLVQRIEVSPLALPSMSIFDTLNESLPSSVVLRYFLNQADD